MKVKYIVPVTLTALLAASTVHAASFTQMIDFGDSLSDVGNIHALTTLGHLSDPSQPIVPGAPAYYDGRFSNGPIWLDQLAGLLGLPDVTPSLGGGTDYAYGDATSGSGNTQTYIPNIQTQIGQWTGSHTANATQLYTVWGGSNDLFDALAGGQTPQQQTAAAQQAADNIAAGVQSLYNDGARNVLVANLPDLGLIPHYRDSAQQSQASNLTAAFNIELSSQLSQLQSASPGLNLYALNVAGLFQNLMNDPSAYGLSNVTDRAYTGDDNFIGNGTSVADPSGYLFWDADHPTTVGHGLLARAAYSMLVPEPTCLIFIAGGFLALRRRRAA